MVDVLEKVGAVAGVGELLAALDSQRRVNVAGTTGSGCALVTAWLARTTGRPVLVVCAGGEEAEEFAEDMNLPGEDVACYFPALEVLPGDVEEPSETILRARLAVLRHLALGHTDERPAESDALSYLEPGPATCAVVTSVRALLQPTCTAEELREGSCSLAVGSAADPRALVEWLADNGYWPAPRVEQPGQYCLRGGILDVFSHGAPEPVRLEFFGDNVDSIRAFDPATQLSSGRITRCQLTVAERSRDSAGRRAGSLLSFIEPQTLIVLVDAERLWERAETIYEHTQQRDLLAAPEDVRCKIRDMSPVAFGEEGDEGPDVIRIESSQRDVFGPDLDSTLTELTRICRDFRHTVVYCISPAEADRFRVLLRDRAFEALSRLRLGIGRLNHGVLFPGVGLALVPHHRLFGRYRQRRLLRHVREGRPIESAAELEPGDMVVHIRHGIARFRGISVLERNGADREHLELEFAEDVRVHVPCDRIELVHRYIGVGGREPQLSAIRGARWRRAKKRAQDAIEDLAAELLEMQAVRQTQRGIAAPVGTEWQQQFESEFPYEETEDQIGAIRDIKVDMGSVRPMDRLICGDVGYGKTEVAMRAAFAAVMGERQVAVLVPTTVLAQQHVRTFRERMADYPIRVEMLSRFLTPGQASRVRDALAHGTADIVIGTHSLLSDNIRFKNLGLVIIDEEQRFGVEHKEKLKRLRATVDVLTLTATPIPRTLHMALMGVREISALQTPPRDRQAIETHVMPFDARVLRRAVLRELDREGQVFIIHNRVKTIRAFAAYVQQIVPEARIAVAHGQMPEQELSEAMRRFIEGELDVLVSTTIVESGLDIPNANTLIVDRADILGLAEMHQLRGRIGRYIHKAYAYFFKPVNRPITPEAEQRLDTIRRFSQLGAGFDIAMRDLEIRGAGNILGPSQSGHIAAIGYNLYCRLLTRTVRHLKGEPSAEQPEVVLDFGLDAYLPDDYVPTPGQKMEMYRRVNRAATMEQVDEVAAAFRDRFGPPPTPAANLIMEARLRVAAGGAGVDVIRVQGGRVHFDIRDDDAWRRRFPDGGPRVVLEGLAVIDHGFPSDDPARLAEYLLRILETGKMGS